MTVDRAPPRYGWALSAVFFMGLFSVVNGGQRWFVARDLPLGRYGWFAWDALPLAAFAFSAWFALGRPKQAITGLVSEQHQNDPLLMLRAFACLMVLGGHGVGFAFQAPDYLPDLVAGKPGWLLAPSPQCGVWIFFVLSGYLIGKGFNTGRYEAARLSVARYLGNRCLRILPVFWLMTGSMLLIAHTSMLLPRNLPEVFNTMAFNVDGRYPYKPIDAFWSISTEMQFYIVAPLIFVALRLPAASLAACMLGAAAIVIVESMIRIVIIRFFGTQGEFDAFYMPLAGNIDLFLLGMLASRAVVILRSGGRELPFGWGAGWMVMFALYVLISWLYTHALVLKELRPAYVFAAFGTSVAGLASALAILCFELAPHGKSRPWAKPFESLGVLTYALYSLHEPVFLAFKYHLPAPPNFAASVGLCALVSGALVAPAWAMHRFVEQPFLNLKWRPKQN